MKQMFATSKRGLLFGPKRSFRLQVLVLALPPVLIAGFVSFGVWTVIQDSVQTEMRLDRANESLRVLQRTRADVLEAQSSLRGFTISGEEHYLDAYFASVGAVESIAANVSQNRPPDDPVREIIGSVASTFGQYRSEVADPLIRVRRSAHASESEAALDARLQGLMSELREDGLISAIKTEIREGVEQSREALARELEATAESRESLLWVGIVGPPVAVLVSVILTSLLLLRVRRGIGAVADAAAHVEQGHLDWRLDWADNREMSQVVSGFNSMLERLENRVQTSQSLDRLTRVLQTCRSSEEAFDVAGRFLPRMLPGCSGAICIYRSSRDLVSPAVLWGEAAELDGQLESFEPEHCWALRSGYPHDYLPDRGDPPCEHLLAGESRNTLCVPLFTSEETMGVLVAVGASDEALDEETRALCTTLGETLALSIGNIRLREALRHQAIRDPLTGLYNRRFLDEVLERELSRSQRTESSVSLLALDIDHFKRFNDQWGHDAGDAVLGALAQQLREHARAMDLACRLGGEEFLLVLPRCGHEAALEVAERVRQNVERLAVSHQNQPLEHVTVSIGVSTFPDHAADAATLLKAADRALYDAKSGGRNCVRLAK